MRTIQPVRKYTQRGAAAVEFAIVAMLFLTILVGIMEFGRWLFTLNSVAEATRLGARVAVVCDLNDTAIKARMRTIAPNLTDAMIGVNYQPAGCTVGGATPCNRVRVGVGSGVGASDYQINLLFPFSFTVTIPSFTTTLPAESLESVNGTGESNPVCA